MNGHERHLMDYSLSGLSSGFDWKTFINQIMAVQNAPIDRLNAEKVTNLNRQAALVDLDTKMAALGTAATALGSGDLFSSRLVSSTTPNSSWQATAAGSTAAGSYELTVTQLATTARRQGAAELGQALNSTDDGIGLTLATLPTATAITAGTFTVNGQAVTVALTDTLDQVFTAIAAATSDAVTASYDHTTDKITLTGSSVVLGAANDTSNFLTALKLGNNATLSTTVSTGKLGTTQSSTTLATARLQADLTALVAAGDRTFLVNGVSIAYNVNTDSLSAVLTRITESAAGVTALYDSTHDRVVLANNTTGDTGIAVSESSPGLLAALGLTSGAILVRGQNAEFSLNGGASQSSASNTLTAAEHGIAGLMVAVDTLATQTLAVSSDTAGMRSVIENFLVKFNDLQSYVDENTKTTMGINGKVTAAILAGNREVQSWADHLHKLAFAQVAGLSGTISRLEHLGIDFNSTSGVLKITDSAKLTTALQTQARSVAEFFQTSTTGWAATLSTYVDQISTANALQEDRLNAANTSLDTSMGNLQRRLDQQRAALTASFIAMESAQSLLKSQSTTLANAFPSSSKSA